jgi:type IV secretory pathway VirB6-like protein
MLCHYILNLTMDGTEGAVTQSLTLYRMYVQYSTQNIYKKVPLTKTPRIELKIKSVDMPASPCVGPGM